MYNSDRPTGQYRYFIVLMILIIWVVIYFQRLNVSILMVDDQFLNQMGIAEESGKQGLLMTLFLISYSISNLLGAPISDFIGPRKTMILGLVLASAAMFIGGVAGTFITILLVRVMLGVAQGIYFPTQSSMVQRWFPPGERGLANGICGFGGCIGPIIAVPFFAFLISQWDWQSVFLEPAVAGLIAVLFPLTGLITDESENNRWVSQQEKDFIRTANKDANQQQVPDFHLQGIKKILASGTFWMMCITYTAYLCIWWGLVTWSPQYLVMARGYSVYSIGWVAAIPYIFAGVGILLGGYISDKSSNRAKLGAISLVGAALCILIAIFIPSNSAAVAFIAVALAFNEFYYAPVWAMLQKLLPSELIGTGSGLMNGICNMISASSPLIIGLLIQQTHSYDAGLFFLVIIGMIGAIACTSLYIRTGRRIAQTH